MIIVHKYKCNFCFGDDIPKGQTFEAALEFMKQYKFNDLEVSDHQTEDVKSDRPFSNLKVEMSEATNMRVVSFAQDITYDVTRGKVKILKRVGLVVLLKSLTDSVELVKVHQTLCRGRC